MLDARRSLDQALEQHKAEHQSLLFGPTRSQLLVFVGGRGLVSSDTYRPPHYGVQERVRSGAIELRKVNGLVTPADLFTNHLTSRDRVAQLIELFTLNEGVRIAPDLVLGF